MFVTDRHDKAIAVKVAFNPNTNNQPLSIALEVPWAVLQSSHRTIANTGTKIVNGFSCYPYFLLSLKEPSHHDVLVNVF